MLGQLADYSAETAEAIRKKYAIHFPLVFLFELPCTSWVMMNNALVHHGYIPYSNCHVITCQIPDIKIFFVPCLRLLTCSWLLV
jgi:hypothetical protein